MSNDAPENGQKMEESGDDIPQYHLYIRASLIDGEKKGACPMSQWAFMMSYLLAKCKNIDFKVWTVNQTNPPQDFKDKNRAKIYPFIEGISGQDVNGQSIAGYMPDQADDVEKFFQSVNTNCQSLRRPTNVDKHIYGKVMSISTKFNAFMKGNGSAEAVTNILRKIDSHLEENGTKFLDGDELSYTDCFVLPRLQHVRVAGKFFKGYEIPYDLKNLYRYLKDAYLDPAFYETLPDDDDINKFYWQRYGDMEQRNLRKQLNFRGDFGKDNRVSQLTSIPDEVEASLRGTATNDEFSDGEEQQQYQEQEQEQQQYQEQEQEQVAE